VLYVLQLEELDERYTSQWKEWFKEELERNGTLFRFISPPSSGKIGVGTVLDASGTCMYKAQQLFTISELFNKGQIRDGDKFLVMDLWFPGLEMIPYMAELYNVKVEIYAFLHAGSYTQEDFAAPMAPWAHWFERGWGRICDKIFVGSQYHKDKFLRMRMNEYKDNVVVTGNPFMLSAMPYKTAGYREKLIVHSNRFDPEKRPELFLEFIDSISIFLRLQEWKVIIVTSREYLTRDIRLAKLLEKFMVKNGDIVALRIGLSKQEYYEIMCRASIFVSTTIEENFGYCAVEAMAGGAIPLVPDNFAFKEYVPEALRYNGPNDLRDKFYRVAKGEVNYSSATLRGMVSRFEDSIGMMIKEMGL